MSRPIPSAPKQPLQQPQQVEEVSAGGIMVDFESDEAFVAVICRTNRGGKKEWCLPKGHVESGEELEDTALREVEEETGISGLIVDSLGTVEYSFVVDGMRIHKTVYHFLMKKTGGYLTIENDPDQEADDAKWIPLYELKNHLSFPNEKRMLTKAYEIYEQSK
ncbi:MAG: NUDIX hydrolase [Micrococcaceae bacterium]